MKPVEVIIKQSGIQICELRIEELERPKEDSSLLSLQFGIELTDSTRIKQRVVKMLDGVDGDLDNPVLQLLCCLESMLHEGELTELKKVVEGINTQPPLMRD